jgi:hypothetical protein
MLLPWPRIHASVLATTLIGMIYLAAISQPPVLTVSDLWALSEEGEVEVRGALVSLQTFESGTERLVLSDMDAGASVIIVCMRGPGAPPSQRLGFGDLISARGTCTFENSAPIVFSRYQDIAVTEASSDFLTVGMLCDLWPLLINDEIGISGHCFQDNLSGYRLADGSGGSTIVLKCGFDLRDFVGPVSLRGVLRVDHDTMALVLEVISIGP